MSLLRSPEKKRHLEQELGFPLPEYRLPYETFYTSYGIGVVGLHWVMNILHLPAYRAARYRINAAADISEEAIETTTGKQLLPQEARIYRDYHELINDPNVDIVDSTFGHVPSKEQRKLQLVLDCVEAGKPVMIHKPAASTLGVAERMQEASESSGIPVCINKNCRYNPASYTVKQLLDASRLGRPSIIELALLAGRSKTPRR